MESRFTMRDTIKVLSAEHYHINWRSYVILDFFHSEVIFHKSSELKKFRTSVNKENDTSALFMIRLSVLLDYHLLIRLYRQCEVINFIFDDEPSEGLFFF